MNFALILLVLSIASGFVWLLDILFWKRKRAPEAKVPVLIRYAREFFPIFLAVLLLRSFLIEPFRIPSGSLEPTLKVGDFVAVNKFAYGLRLPVSESKVFGVGEPQTGQIAVFRWPPDPSYDYIKRVIGVPGDTVQYRNKVLFINGKEMKQDFVEYTTDESSGHTVAKYHEKLGHVAHAIYVRPEVPAADFEVKVPKGYYFMMGDNRDDSSDSRIFGFVPESNLRGRAFLVWLSWNGKTDSLRWSSMGRFIH